MFSGTRPRLIRWLGFEVKNLSVDWVKALDIYSENGAVTKVGEIESIEILHRKDGSSPVHQSSYNPKDKAWVLSVRIKPADGSKSRTHHVFLNGTGTIRIGDKQEYSTSSRN